MRRSMAHRGPRVVRHAREIRERSPMLFALLIASFLVTLLCLYVSAYAGVNADRHALSKMKEQMREVEREQRLLNAKVAMLTQPNIILERARALGLVPAPPEAQHLLLQEAPAGESPATPITTDAAAAAAPAARGE